MSDDDDANMGRPTLSVEHMLESIRDPREAAAAQAAAHADLAQSVEDDTNYWARISSTVYGEEFDSSALDKVADDFKDYAKSWLRLGNDLNLITDFAAHRQAVVDKVDRGLKGKATRAAAAARKAALISAGANDAAARSKNTEEQRAAQVIRDAARAKAQEELQATMFVPVDHATLPRVDFAALLDLLDTIDEKYFKNAPDVLVDLPELSGPQRQQLNGAYEHMMALFHDAPHKRKYGYTAQDHSQPKLAMGGEVPSYFANVKDQSIFRRKLLSMAGLRNLLVYGPAIYAQLRDRLFVGNVAQYADGTGLKLMKSMTGNLVDLDSVVLRCSCSATLNAINASNTHKKLPTFANSDAFGTSQQAQDIALACAVPLLQDFAAKLKLTPAQIDARKIATASLTTPAHVAGDNNDRGNHPIWQYKNAGQNSFHANVPNLDDVTSAVLKAPFHCLRHWCFIFAVFGHDPIALAAKVEDAFANLIDDSCFNYKAKAIEDFGAKLAHEGTIVDVLQRTQAENQRVFTAAFFEADDEAQTKEIAEMTRCVAGRKGRDKTGKVRDITEADVKSWCVDPSVKL